MYICMYVHNLDGLQSSKLCHGSGSNCQSLTADSQIQSRASPGMICDAQSGNGTGFSLST